MDSPLLDIRHLSVSFSQCEIISKQREVQAVRDLNLTLNEGEIAVVAGSSGSGKSVLAHSILDILPCNAVSCGEIRYRGELLSHKRIEKLRGGEIALIPQSISYLDPLMKIGLQLTKGKKDRASKEKAEKILERYQLGKETAKKYPFELSGGMARRVLTAAALFESPDLIIADEPTPGLHREASRQLLNELRRLADSGSGVLIITHDLEPVLKVADKIIIIYDGMTVEEVSAEAFISGDSLRHPYSKALRGAACLLLDFK